MLRTIFTAIFLVGAAAALASAGPTPTIDAGTWARFLEARASYKLNCSPCHGLEGAAGLIPYAPSFALGEGADGDYGLMLLTIQEGIEFMPPWKDVLSYEEQDWALFYSISLAGDNVYRKRCASCHVGAAPRVPEVIPRGDALAAYDGTIHVTSGTDVSPTWDQKEQVAVVKMLRTLAEER